jgi:hypothetical protein
MGSRILTFSFMPLAGVPFSARQPHYERSNSGQSEALLRERLHVLIDFYVQIAFSAICGASE